MSNPAQDNPAGPSWNDEAFSEYVLRIREELVQRRDKFPFWSTIQDSTFSPGGGEIWYGDSPYYVKLIGAPGTLAGNVSRLRSDLPLVISVTWRSQETMTERKSAVYEDVDPDLENWLEEIVKLPLIEFDSDKHFAKEATYKQEIRYLLQCKGSPHVIQLLGRTEKGALVFPKFKHDFMRTVVLNTNRGRIQNITRWMLEIIHGVAYLHSCGIVHRDLTMRNILQSDRLVICDLQCLNASSHCRPPEIDGDDFSKFSFASDVFALGALLWECCFYNNPQNRHVLLDNPPPPPFHNIFLACTHEKPEARPTLMQLRTMYEAIRQPNH